VWLPAPEEEGDERGKRTAAAAIDRAVMEITERVGIYRTAIDRVVNRKKLVGQLGGRARRRGEARFLT
jgi:hypothetical protein